MPEASMLEEPDWSEPSSQMWREWLQQPMQQEPEKTPSMWMPQLATTLYLIPLSQVQSMVPISLVFNADLGTISGRTVPTTIALIATGLPLVTTNQFVQSKSVDYAKRRDTLLPTALLMMTRTITTSLRMRDMLGTESVTQGNKGGSVMVFLSFLSSPYGLTISPSMYGYNITQSPM